MSVTPDDVRHIAALARLAIPSDRLPSLAAELSGILGHMDALRAVEGQGAYAASEAARTGMPLRDDQVAPVRLQHPRERFAPAMREGFFTVPRLATHDDGESGA